MLNQNVSSGGVYIFTKNWHAISGSPRESLLYGVTGALIEFVVIDGLLHNVWNCTPLRLLRLPDAVFSNFFAEG